MPKPTWRKSSYTDNGTCVEMADLGDDIIGVRNSNDPTGPMVRFTRAEVAAWLAGSKAGEFDDLA